MSLVEEVRKGIQDLVTPDLRAVIVRLEVVEKQLAEMKGDMKELRGEVKSSFADAERKAEKRHEEMVGNIRQVIDYAAVLQRLSRIEEAQKRLQQ